MDLEDVNVDELGEGETSEDEPLGAEDDLGNGGEVGGDRQFFEAEVNISLKNQYFFTPCTGIQGHPCPWTVLFLHEA